MRQRFKVTGMSCAACSAGVERAVGRLKGVNSVEVSLVAKSMVCDFDENIISEKEIANAVKKAGFKAIPKNLPIRVRARTEMPGQTRLRKRTALLP